MNSPSFLTNFSKNRYPLYLAAIYKSQNQDLLTIKKEAFYADGSPNPRCYSLHFANGESNDGVILSKFWDIFDELKEEFKETNPEMFIF